MLEKQTAKVGKQLAIMENVTTEQSMRTTCITDIGGGSVNEDSFVITSNLFGVFDGATGLLKYTDAMGNTGGLLASKIAMNVFEVDPNIPFFISNAGDNTSNQ
jgi:serine/threonine protein phosphatase PrpC